MECMNARENRVGIDNVKDRVDKNLVKENDNIRKYQQQIKVIYLLHLSPRPRVLLLLLLFILLLPLLLILLLLLLLLILLLLLLLLFLLILLLLL